MQLPDEVKGPMYTYRLNILNNNITHNNGKVHEKKVFENNKKNMSQY